ncbi:hypothetical protein B0I00_0631 [Novosphingobium kunmingense]|uniref:DOMON-like domain-containing protein n=1 Tax=Novosphingobium kunmingense TaxID=1211806 RepID=A0A2N0I2M0_9SPHN|nr:DOMON-like domain-containing protein [Novosphingobium kunmingense]PKB25432.1 hypothetical protein B0I00_0631 [Novosphingobium kunmingense]
METFGLVCHPDHPPVAVRSVDARISAIDNDWVRLRWRIDGSDRLVVPRFAGKGRADGLWQTTCFELLLRPAATDHYVELNLSPSERWAAYDFTGYRAGMSQRSVPREPDCTMRAGRTSAIFDSAVPRPALPQLPWTYGLCAVIEEEGGVKSYWAIEHPPGKPDFHDPACFAATLAAPADQ